jgi:hypothetical protein
MAGLVAPFAEDAFVDLVTPDGRLLWTGPEMYDTATGRPHYTTVQVAKFFFGKGQRWVYKYLLEDPVMSHPQIGELDLMRTPTVQQARRWRLYDVELWAHLLAARGVLNGVELARTIRLVKISAEMWGYQL